MSELIKLKCSVCGRIEYTTMEERIDEEHGLCSQDGEMAKCDGHMRKVFENWRLNYD